MYGKLVNFYDNYLRDCKIMISIKYFNDNDFLLKTWTCQNCHEYFGYLYWN